MFNKEAVNRIYAATRPLLANVLELETDLAARFFGMEQAIRCIALASMTGEAMVMIGPPGTAKSRLIRAYCSLIGVLDRDPRDPDAAHGGAPAASHKKDERYFEYLLTQFTEPSELFGYFDLAKLMAAESRLERVEAGQMQRAEVVFLDEVFNASSAILNALLTFMNERKFHDRGQVHDTPLRMLFSATNHPPREEGLGAVYDRFLLRCRMENVANGHEPLARLLGAAWTETHSHEASHHGKFASLPESLEDYRETIDRMTTKGELKVDPQSAVIAGLASLVATVRDKALSDMSNRRLVKFSAVVLAQALLRAQSENASTVEIRPRDLKVIIDYGLDKDDEGTMEKLRQELMLA